MSLPLYSPMLAVPWRTPFSDASWVYEVKWDGVRALLGWDGSSVSVRSRGGNDLLPAFPEVAGFRWPRPCVIDAELAAFDAAGVPSFELIQRRLGGTGRRAHELAGSVPISVVAFDVIHDGAPLLDAPLEERVGRLDQLDSGLVVRSEQTAEHGALFFEAVRTKGLEGVVAKRIGSRYRPGVRSADWRKISVVNRMRAIVGGFTPGEGGRASTFGGLLLGLLDAGGLRYIGRVGTGFDDRALVALRSALDELASARSPFHLDVGDARFVLPGLVVRVAFKNWTAAGRLRAPVFEGLDSIDPEEVTWATEGPLSQGTLE